MFTTRELTGVRELYMHAAWNSSLGVRTASRDPQIPVWTVLLEYTCLKTLVNFSSCAVNEALGICSRLLADVSTMKLTVELKVRHTTNGSDDGNVWFHFKMW